MRLHFRAYGEGGQGAPLIILHGLFGSLDNWDPISRKLGETVPVFAVDLRNHNRSPHSAEMNHALMAADLREFLADHSSGPAHVLGHSLGGKVAMQFALSHPEQVDRLIVVDMAPGVGEPLHQPIFAALRSVDLASIRTRAEAETALASSIPDLATRRFLLKSLDRNGQNALAWRFNLDALQRNYRALNAAVTGPRACERPALFVRGERSDYVRDEDWPAIRNLFSRAELETVPGAGHWVHTDAPEIFLEALKKFLAKKF